MAATINGEEVPVEAWERVRPKAGTMVLLRPVLPCDVLRNVLTIAVVVSALALGQIYGPILAGQLGLAAGGVGQSLLTAGITASVRQAVRCSWIRSHDRLRADLVPGVGQWLLHASPRRSRNSGGSQPETASSA